MSRLFGGVIQNGYVVRNIEAAMRHWIDVLGVGPWFYIDHLPVADFQYKGQPSPVDISLALANSGTLQIELIQPHSTELRGGGHPAHRKPPDVRICRLSIQSDVGTRPPSTSTPHLPAFRARRW